LKSGQVRVKVACAGICGTDIHLWRDGGYPSNPPVILGHELSGIIDRVWDTQGCYSPGLRVTTETYFYTCGHCFFCKTGRPNLCEERKSIGSTVDGGFAEYIVVPANNIHRLPDNISFEEGALTEPFACCVQAVLEYSGIQAGDRVLIIGPGTIGLLCLQLVKLVGATSVIVGTKNDTARLEVARKLGADHLYITSDRSYIDKVKSICDDLGPDIVLECSGSQEAIHTGIEIIRKGGTFIQIGLSDKEISVDTNKIALKEIQIKGTFATKWWAWKYALRLMEEKKVNLEPLISGIIELEGWEEAFNKVLRSDGLKYLFKF